jgi:hypothetical protein
MTGRGAGLGYNINIGWHHEDGEYGDAEFLAAWDLVVMVSARGKMGGRTLSSRAHACGG